MRIMIVDDEPRACHLLEIFLKKRGDVDEIVCFRRSEEALLYAADHEVDAAFLDVEMPGMNGLQLAMHLLDLNKKTKQIPPTFIVIKVGGIFIFIDHALHDRHLV